jgi:hypothetical protein
MSANHYHTGVLTFGYQTWKQTGSITTLPISIDMAGNEVIHLCARIGDARGCYNHQKELEDFKGSSDIIGVAKDGRMIAIECKRPGKKPTPEQEFFLNEVKRRGGIAFVATSYEEVRAIL